MLDAQTFQQEFGAALAGLRPVNDPLLARALAVHRNTSAKAARDALAANYPVVRALVGEEPFAAAAAAHIEITPPRDPRLCLYGAEFAHFVSGYAPFGEVSYLADVARLERLAIESLFAADAPTLDGQSVALDLDAPLRLHPATRFARFTSPAVTLWLAHQPDADPNSLDQITWQAEDALVTRPDNSLIVSRIPPGGIAFLEICAAGCPLGEAAAAAGDGIAPLFSLLITAGAFA